ncbi:Cellulose synthase (UDP-forming) [Bertholletia excelsa]
MDGVKPKTILHAVRLSRRTTVIRLFVAVYTAAILAVLCRHVVQIFQSTTFLSLCLSLTMMLADFVLVFMWFSGTCFRVRMIHRQVFPENLRKVVTEEDFPAMDIFICTADPYKEPPMTVVNTALSVLAYDYPMKKLSVYVSDDGGSAFTLFAFMEAAKFARHWLPFCRKNKVVERCPEVYLSSTNPLTSQTEQIKTMYKSMKKRVENVVQRGKVWDEYITSEEEREAFGKWTPGFIRQDHPPVIQVLLDSSRDKDVSDQTMPNLIYMSREKSKTSPHHFKAGALNALLRVSAVMTNSPIILTVDCDMYSNDPQTPHQVLCYFVDAAINPKLGYIQFPQRYHGLSQHDIYASELKRWMQINSKGIDGLQGPNCVGTGCFFCRRVFFGGPSSFTTPEIPNLWPDYVVNGSIQAQSILRLAHQVAGCKYEHGSNWGSKLGFKYGSLVEDYYTGYRLHCEGWQTVFCHPDRAAFLGEVPINLNDVVSQGKRWHLGLLEVAFSKYSPITFGVKSMGPLMGLCYAHYAFWPIWSIPITIYAFLPQLALLGEVSIFPRVLDIWFFLYVFLFIGAYALDCVSFILAQGTFRRWLNDQRMWLVKGLTCSLFASIEFLTKCLGMTTHGFNVTSKAVDDEERKRYDQGIFDFGVHSPMFVVLAMAAVVNLVAFLGGLIQVSKGRNIDGLFVQMFLAGFGVLNSWPIYEAMVLRSDKGRMPTKTTFISTFLAWALCTAACQLLKM